MVLELVIDTWREGKGGLIGELLRIFILDIVKKRLIVCDSNAIENLSLQKSLKLSLELGSFGDLSRLRSESPIIFVLYLGLAVYGVNIGIARSWDDSSLLKKVLRLNHSR
jgi:hypothetical protein